jgi:hypothetical protein
MPSRAPLLLACAAAASGLPAAAAAFSYDRAGALTYAHTWWNSTNHDCTTPYTACSPFSYWGRDSCGYESHGGDCADFVSQCLVVGGNHTPLVKLPCRGYPCGVEEVGAEKLGACLAANYGWRSTCGPHQAPPADIEPGDVLLFHGTSCNDEEAHATLVVYVNLPFVGLAAHSTDVFNASYAGYASEFSFFDWLHFEG